MSIDRKAPSAAFWATVVVVALLLYPISFGPACWMVERGFLPVHRTSMVYRPVLWVAVRGKPEAVRRALIWYGGLATHPPLDPVLWQMAVESHVIQSTYRPLMRH